MEFIISCFNSEIILCCYLHMCISVLSNENISMKFFLRILWPFKQTALLCSRSLFDNFLFCRTHTYFANLSYQWFLFSDCENAFLYEEWKNRLKKETLWTLKQWSKRLYPYKQTRSIYTPPIDRLHILSYSECHV